MKNIILAFVLVSFFNIAYSQKKNPDEISGFKQFKLLSSINNYLNSNTKKISESKYKISPNDFTFLDHPIEEVILSEYNKKVISIKLILNEDIEHILSELFKNSNEYDYLDVGLIKSRTYGNIDTYDGNFIMLDFKGNKNELIYSKSKALYSSSEKLTTYSLEVKIKNPEKAVHQNLSNKHKDDYLAEFGANSYPTPKNKIVYQIPLYKKGNISYLKVKVQDEFENFILDTGADGVSISKMLYLKLKEQNNIIETGKSVNVRVASGNKVKMKIITIKKLQINELYLNSIDAVVNSTNDISLLGQSVLRQFGKIEVNNNTNILTITK